MLKQLEILDISQKDGVLKYVFDFSEDICPNIWADMEGEIHVEPSIAPLRFIARYNRNGEKIKEENKKTGKIEIVQKEYLHDKFDISIYDNDTEIQRLLAKFGLDKEKFWYLIRFLHNYAYGYCMIGQPFGKTREEQLELFCTTFKQKPFMYIELRDCEDGKDRKVGKIDNLRLLRALNDYCLELLKEEGFSTYGNIKEPEATSIGFFMYYMVKLLDEFFFFIGITTKRKYKDGSEKEVLKRETRKLTMVVLSLEGFFEGNQYDDWRNLKKLIERYSKLDDGNRINGIYRGYI